MKNANHTRCPRCLAGKEDTRGRTCESCGYRGDWIQPGHEHLFACSLWRDGDTGWPEPGPEAPYGSDGCTCHAGHWDAPLDGRSL